MESESTEISQESWVSQAFKPNFAGSGVKSTELDKIVCLGFFFPSLQMNHLCYFIMSSTGRKSSLIQPIPDL